MITFFNQRVKTLKLSVMFVPYVYLYECFVSLYAPFKQQLHLTVNDYSLKVDDIIRHDIRSFRISFLSV